MYVGYPETGAVGEGSSSCVGGVSVANLGVCVKFGVTEMEIGDQLQHDMGKRMANGF